MESQVQWQPLNPASLKLGFDYPSLGETQHKRRFMVIFCKSILSSRSSHAETGLSLLKLLKIIVKLDEIIFILFPYRPLLSYK